MGINKTLKELKAQMDESFKNISTESREEYIKNLPIGESIPPEGKIYGPEYMDRFSRKAEEIRHSVYDAISKEKKDLAKKKATAPTTEAVNAISLMKLTSNLTSDDVNNMLDQYGDNYGCFKAIKSIAADQKIIGDFGVHKYDVIAAGLDYVEKHVGDSFSTSRYAREGVTVASSLGWDSTCDQELPE